MRALVAVQRELIEAKLRRAADGSQSHDDHTHEHYRGAGQAKNHAVADLAGIVHRADDSTVAEHRDANTNAYAARLVMLWLALKAGKLGLQEVHEEADEAWQRHLDAAAAHIGRTHDVPAERLLGAAAIPVTVLASKAMVRVVAMGQRIAYPKLKTPTDPQIRAAGNQAAGSMWGSHYALEAMGYAFGENARSGGYTNPLVHVDSFDKDTGEPIGKTYRREKIRARWDTAEDDRVCIECELREGETFDVDSIPYFPGGGGTSCEGACRCDLIFYTAQGEGYETGPRGGAVRGGGGRDEQRADVPAPRVPKSAAVPRSGIVGAAAKLVGEQLGRAKAEQTLDAAEREIVKHRGYEEAVIVNPRTGAELWRKRGEASAVDFTPAETNSMQGMILTHNHPGSTSLSPQDVGLAMSTDMQSVRAVGSLGVRYSMERPAEGWPRPIADGRDVLRAFVLKDGRMVDLKAIEARIVTEVRAWLLPKLESLAPAEREAEMDRQSLVYWHRIWERVSLDIDLGYKREEWAP